MCQEIITHQMHHDVRVPMALPDGKDGEERTYSNPLRTVKHECEIACPIPGTWVASGSHGTEVDTDGSAAIRPCPDHTCCLQMVRTERCAAPWPVPEDANHPRQCAYYTLVHRYIRLQKLCCKAPALKTREQQHTVKHHLSQSPQDRPACIADHHAKERSDSSLDDDDNNDHMCNCKYFQPAWRRDLREVFWGFPAMSGGRVNGACWAPRFMHEGKYYPRWENSLFLEAEKLHGLVAEVEVYAAHVRDLETGVVRGLGAYDAAAAAETARGLSVPHPVETLPPLLPLAFKPPPLPPTWSHGVRLNPILASEETMAILIARARLKELDLALGERDRLEGLLDAQRNVIHGLLQWAQDPCPECWGC